MMNKFFRFFLLLSFSFLIYLIIMAIYFFNRVPQEQDVSLICSKMKKYESLDSKRKEYYRSCIADRGSENMIDIRICSDKAEYAYPSVYSFIDNEGRGLNSFKIIMSKGCD